MTLPSMLDVAPSGPIFGRVVTGNMVEQAVLDTLRKWEGTYLSALEVQEGIDPGTLKRIVHWQAGPSFDKWPEDSLPACVVISTGLVETPNRRSGKRWDARWSIGVGIVCSANDQKRTHYLAQLYTAAFRSLLGSHPSLDGFASGADWLHEAYDRLPFDDVRTMGVGMCEWVVQVDNVMERNAGPGPNDPLSPDTTPWPDWPTAETVEVDTDKKGR